MHIEISAEMARLKRTAGWSYHGIKAAWIGEKSFRQWIVANGISIAVMCALDLSALELAFLLSLGLFVLMAELFNSAIEATVDYISTDIHPLAKKAKDTASGAVMITAVAWALSWCIIFFF